MNFDLRVSFVFLSLAHNVVYAYTHVSTISEPHLPENEVRPGCYAKSPLRRMQTCTCIVFFSPNPPTSRLPKGAAIDVHSARVASMFLQPPPHPVLWLGLQSGHLLLINAVSRAPIMVTERHVTSIRCIQSVKALG